MIGELRDMVVIAAIVVVNAVIGFIKKFRAERAMAALKQVDHSDGARASRGTDAGRAGAQGR